MSNQYSFPLLDTEQLLLVLAELEVPLQDPSVLQKPTPETVIPIFKHFLIHVAEVKIEKVHPNAPLNSIYFRNPEQHVDSFPKVAFFRSLHKLMFDVGVKDFGYKDLWKPESARLKHHLSALVNFNCYKLELASEFAEAEDSITAEIKRVNALEQESRKLELEYEEARNAREAEQIVAAEIKADNMHLKADLEKDEADLQTLKSMLASKELKLAELDKQLSAIQLQLQSMEKDRDYWKNQISEDPVRLRQELQSVEEQNVQDELERTELKTELSKTLDKLISVQEKSKEMQRRRTELEAVAAAIEHKKQINGRYKDMQKELIEKTDAIEVCVSQRANLEKIVGQLRERVQADKEKAKARFKDLEDGLDALAQQSSRKDPALKAMSEQVEKLEHEIAGLRRQVLSVRTNHGAKMTKATKSFAEFQAQCARHAQTMKAASKQLMEALPKEMTSAMKPAAMGNDRTPVTTPRKKRRTPLPR